MAFGQEVEVSQYGPRGVIGLPEKTIAGNLVLRVGNEHEVGTWSHSVHVVMLPDEAKNFANSILLLMSEEAKWQPYTAVSKAHEDRRHDAGRT